MPAKDNFRVWVKAALTKEGWTLTHDPLSLPVDERDSFVDLGVERLLMAEKENQKIAIWGWRWGNIRCIKKG